MNLRIATLLLSLLATALPAQERDIVLTGGWLFTSTGAERIRNPGIVIRAGKFLRVGGDTSIAAPNAERIARIENGAEPGPRLLNSGPVLRHGAAGLGSRHFHAADLRRRGSLGGARGQGIQGEGHYPRRAARAHRARAILAIATA